MWKLFQQIHIICSFFVTVNKMKGLLVLPSIWSMGKGRGMPSVHHLIAEVDRTWGAVIITSDEHCDVTDYPSSRLIRVPKLKSFFKSRYIDFFMARLNYLILNFVVLWIGFSLRGKLNFVYANSAIPAVFLIGKLLNIPVIHRMYGTFLFPHLNSFFEKLKRYEEVFLFLFSATAYVITDDGTRGDQVSSYYGIPSEKIHFWRNGVNKIAPSKIDWREKLDFSTDIVMFTTTCRLTSWKRVDRCIKAFKKVIDPNIRLVIAGSGEQATDLQKMAEGDTRIHFLGQIEGELATKLIADSDVYITLHDYSNVGNPMLEALRAGIPVLTCDTGDTASVVQTDISGVCVSAHNEEALINEIAQQIEKLSADVDWRKQLSVGAKTFGLTTLQTWDERINREITLIENLMTQYRQVEHQ
jgi:glycosyltransferase involved in cell wall biosynthesis